MKMLAPCACACLLLLSACSSAPPARPGSAVPGAAVPAAAPSTAAVSAALPTVHRYRCQGGETVSATYPTTDQAVVHYQGRQYQMRIARSGSGARYVGGGLEWWTKGVGRGSDGTLFRHQADGTSGDSIALCKGV